MKKTFFIILLNVVVSLVVYAQITTNEIPPSFDSKVHRIDVAKNGDKIISIPPPDVNLLVEEDRVSDGYENFLHRVSCAIPVNLSLQDSGVCRQFGKDSLFWRLTITVDKAQSLDLVFDKFWLPDGGKLFIYNMQTG